MTALHFDCLSGISGDMTLGALIDLGVPVKRIQAGIDALGLDGVLIEASEVKKAGFRAVSVQIRHPEQHAHRHLHHITDMIDGASDGLTDAARTTAKAIFQEIAEAEAKVHGTTLRSVHFHEVGAIDSIADIVGTAIGLDFLGITHCSASPIPTGTGAITIDHGRVSIPAPATIEILRDVPVAACDIPMELTTPTGAAIVKALVRTFGSMPTMTPRAVGYGAGQRDIEGQANVLRVVLGDLVDASVEAAVRVVDCDRVVELQTNVDNTTAEQIAIVTQRLLEAGALDVWQSPATMKKGRLGSIIHVLTNADQMSVFEDILFEQTATIGIRHRQWDRTKLRRQPMHVETEYGSIAGKRITLPDGHHRFAPEADEILRLTGHGKASFDAIRDAAQAAFQEQGEDASASTP
ncbi:MAG: nickel pincer cofactor biosynthesis protein LarC [Planctomycetota bacterium]